ncbi:alpha 1,3-mannosyltransferase [Purpureocillium lavendulum]|uniref:Alpha 1,3-mannosyltransferase n=1 Tax=Purpureocillium lavendulum TaxID=1247861 RepID=A0AB34FXR7_9HYPO|nr:alpha 1,3-mannosyltransferase [Purpureocillium lavendulum]
MDASRESSTERLVYRVDSPASVEYEEDLDALNWKKETQKSSLSGGRLWMAVIVVLALSLALNVALGALLYDSVSSMNETTFWDEFILALAISHKLVKFHNSINSDKTRYQGRPNEENNKLWERLYSPDEISRISHEQATRLPNKTMPEAPYDGSGYLIVLNVFHNLHCLDSVRRAIYYFHDPRWTTGYNPYTRVTDGAVDSMLKDLPVNMGIDHIDHCIDILRQQIMCSSDTTPNVFQFSPKDSGIRAFASVLHKCRDFNKIKKWAEDHRAPITYAGEDDLTRQQRDVLSALDSTNNIDFVDVLSVFNDSHAGLRNGHWAIKPFAALASRFEEVIVIDADAVFLQLPEKLFAQGPYRRTGAYLFHDRLLWQHAFRERHDWWKDQIKEPSAALNNSRVWIEDYAEECDSGVAVLDKSRAEVFIGLLHIAWQNTHGVREEVSYRLTYGDKETWWLGLELVGAGYEFEQHYGSIVGWERDTQDDDNGAGGGGVCSFVIAHTDEDERLLWFNGSLLKNKLADPESYKVPTAWMTDGVWQKGATKESMSCMVGAEVRKLTGEEQRILQRSIEGARRVDSILKENGTSLSLHQ